MMRTWKTMPAGKILPGTVAVGKIPALGRRSAPPNDTWKTMSAGQIPPRKYPP